METCSDYLERAINGDKDALHCAFVWDDTPQGYRYWESQYLGEIPLDINALDSMLRDDDTPTLWRDMTDAEKGALLLADHEGKVIEKYYGTIGWVSYQGSFYQDDAYRIKPEPKVETMTGYVDCLGRFSNNHAFDNTHHITFDLIDGKPDTASIKMEEL